MSQLTNLIYGYETGGVIKPQEFYIQNTNKWLPHNGGCCYLWTVPAGVTKAVFEVWSGGAGGGFACCCTMGGGGGGGGYMMVETDISAGDQIRMCSAGTSGANMSCCAGFHGCSSYICNGDGTWCMCVEGGLCSARYPRCHLATNCYSCCSMCACCSNNYISGSGITTLECQTSVTGAYRSSQFCIEAGWQHVGSAYGTPGPRPQGTSTCCNSCHGGICGSYSSCCGQACMMMGMHPGGGGMTGWTNDGTCRCGGVGGGGMIYVVYW
jgi:hypothetical protein